MSKKIIFICFFIIISLCFTTCFADELNTEELVDTDMEDILSVSSNSVQEPNLNSRSAVVFDRFSKEVLFGKAENTKRPMASTTKIMTAIVVLEKGNLKDVVEVSKKAASVGGSRLGLKAGEKISVHDLLYGLMLVSGNDAAVALAEYIAGSVEEFANYMNEKASQLNLVNTHFVTPHGLDQAEHYTTAYELAKIADYALNNKKFSEIVSTKYYTVNINGNSKNLSNTNELLGNLEGVNGVKTGFTNGANRCLVTSVKRGNMNIITVVLGADTKKFRTSDSVKLIQYAYQNYTIIDSGKMIEEEFNKWKIEYEKQITINKGKYKRLSIKLNDCDNTYIAMRKKDEGNIRTQIQAIYSLESPIERGKKVAELKVFVGKEEKKRIDIILDQPVPKKNFLDYFLELIINQVKLVEEGIR